MLQQWAYAIDHSSVKFLSREVVGKSLMINLKVIFKGLVSELRAVVAVDVSDNTAVGRTGQVKLWPFVAENLLRRLLQRSHAGTTGVDERAIDVEKIKHRRHARKTASGLSLARLLDFFFAGAFTFGRFVGHLVIEIFVDRIVLVVIVLFHQLTVEKVELALALMRGQR